jgi:hypothetical protein
VNGCLLSFMIHKLDVKLAAKLFER